MHASCSICGDIFTGTDAEVLHSTPCGHIFHYLCLVEWLERLFFVSYSSLNFVRICSIQRFTEKLTYLYVTVSQFLENVFIRNIIQNVFSIYILFYRSKTCPHCRAKVDEKKTVKLYFQLSSYPVKDSGTLENEVQSLKFQLSMKNMDFKKLTEEATEAKAVAKGLRYSNFLFNSS